MMIMINKNKYNLYNLYLIHNLHCMCIERGNCIIFYEFCVYFILCIFHQSYDVFLLYN